MILVIVIELDDVANLAAERRSSEAAENENEGAPCSFFAKMEICGAVDGDKAGIGSVIPHFQSAAMHVRDSVAHHVKGISRAAGHDAKKNKDTSC
jgi:hypothetical protein